MRLAVRSRWYILSVLICCVILMISGCGGGSSDDPADTNEQRKNASVYDRLESLRNEMNMRLPAQYCTGTSGTAGAPADSSSAAGEAWLFEEQMKLLEPAVAVLVSEENALLQKFTSSGDSDSLTGEVSSGDIPVSDWNGDEYRSIAELYRYVANLENDLFSSINVDVLPENREKFKVIPVFSTDSSGSVWLTLYTNFQLPGFEDMERGYMLRLDLDGGAAEQVTADSIYSHQNIKCHSSYCVSFNLSAILSRVSAEEYLAGRNRITFSLFGIDNGFSYSCEFYKLRYSENTFSGLAQRREELTKIILEAV